ncbi:MAG TPA: SBBP repeat-containing protein, partial [Thermodesulfovibrionia bacterium]|nr:SBBP repeat-containing protein [Thermodesulfovibrionia bacterium]
GPAGSSEAFVSWLSSDLKTLLQSTYLGGSAATANEIGNGIAIHPGGDVYVTGHTDSTDFPRIVGGADTVFAVQEAYIAQLSSDLRAFKQSTYLGGTGAEDSGYNVVIHPAAPHDVYVAGVTDSPDLPGISGGADTDIDGTEAFVSRLDNLSSSGATSIDLSVTKTDSSDPVLVNTNLTYTIQVTNSGTGNATNVVLTDTLPAGVIYMSNDSGCTEASGIVTCNIGNLNNGTSDTVHIVVTATTVDTITNTATVTATEADSSETNDTATEETSVTNIMSDLSVTKTASPDPALVDTDLTYAVVVTNNGPDSATNVTLTDTLPTGVTYVSNDRGCTEAAGTVTCNLGTINNGTNDTVHIVVTPTTAGTITNTAAVQSTSLIDPTTINNTESIHTDVNAPVDGNITKGKIVDKTAAGKDSFKIDMTCPGLADAVTDLAAETVFVDIGPYGTSIPGNSFTQKGKRLISKQGKSTYTLYPDSDRLVLNGKSIISLDGTANDIQILLTIGGWSCKSVDTWKEKESSSGIKFTLP